MAATGHRAPSYDAAMQAAVLYEPGRRLEVVDVQLEGPRRGEVRVRIAAAGVCHSDHHYMKGDLPTPLPVVLGHEGAGIVEEVGEGVTGVVPGDHVVLLWRTSCGRCELCSTGRPALCAVSAQQRSSGFLDDGTSRLSRDGVEIRHLLGVSCFAEQAVVPGNAVLKIPDDVPMAIAALAGCSVMTGVGAAVNTARVAPGSSVLVIGAGGVGLSVIMGAVLSGAAQVIAVDINPGKLEMARGLGATDTVDASATDPVRAVREMTRGGADYAFEVIGLPEAISQAVRSLRPGGTAVAVGVARVGAVAEINALDLVLQEKTLKGSLYGSTRPQQDFPRLFELYRRGRLPLDRLLSREFRLDEVNEAYDAMLAGTTARSVLLPGASTGGGGARSQR